MTDSQIYDFLKIVILKELKQAMLSVSDSKISRADGFMSGFFKATRDTMGKEVCITTNNLFKHRKIL